MRFGQLQLTYTTPNRQARWLAWDTCMVGGRMASLRTCQRVRKSLTWRRALALAAGRCAMAGRRPHPRRTRWCCRQRLRQPSHPGRPAEPATSLPDARILSRHCPSIGCQYTKSVALQEGQHLSFHISRTSFMFSFLKTPIDFACTACRRATGARLHTHTRARGLIQNQSSIMAANALTAEETEICKGYMKCVLAASSSAVTHHIACRGTATHTRTQGGRARRGESARVGSWGQRGW